MQLLISVSQLIERARVSKETIQLTLPLRQLFPDMHNVEAYGVPASNDTSLVVVSLGLGNVPCKISTLETIKRAVEQKFSAINFQIVSLVDNRLEVTFTQRTRGSKP